MGCSDITQGIAEVCKGNQGGNEEIYMINFVKDAFTVTGGLATAINPLVTVAYKFHISGNGHTLTQEAVSDRDAGTTQVTQTVVCMLKKIDEVKNETLDLLVKGYSLAVVKDRNGKYHVVGLDDGIDFSNSSTTGSTKTDMNGYTLTGVATTKSMAPILDSATTTAFLALAV